MQSQPKMKCQQNMEFIRQALIDYSNTMAPSARAAFEQMAQHNLNTVAETLSAPDEGKTEVAPQAPVEE